MNRTRVVSLVAVLCMVPATSSAGAETDPDPTGSDSGGQLFVATFGDPDSPEPPDQMTFDQLAKAFPDAPIDQVEKLSLEPSRQNAPDEIVSLDESGDVVSEQFEWFEEEEVSAAADNRYGTYKSWKDANGRWIHLRNGYYDAASDRGFGAAKTYRKHNLTSTLLQRMTSGGYNSTLAGTVRTYRRPALLWDCTLRPCIKVDDTFVRLVQDYRKLSDGKSFGVVSGYCEAADHRPRCKDWVNRTF